jgi:cation:H+ antiporter
MFEVALWAFIFAASLAVLIKASDLFTDSSEKIGLHFGVPQLIIGVTLVAVGTSLPELVSSVFAVIYGYSEIVVGNVVGSNITNICLIVGIAAVVGGTLTTRYELINIDLPMFLGSQILFAMMIWNGAFTVPEAAICLAGIAVYLFYAVSVEKEIEESVKALAGENGDARPRLGWKTPAVLLASAALLYLGAKYTVEAAVRLSDMLRIGREIIALTAVAVGTSLPELFVSVAAARRGRSELAIGNVLGSNIFNSFAVMGVPALFGRIVVPESILTFSLPLMLAVTLIFVFITQDKEVTKWEGWLFILFYLFFLGHILGLL